MKKKSDFEFQTWAKRAVPLSEANRFEKPNVSLAHLALQFAKREGQKLLK